MIVPSNPDRKTFDMIAELACYSHWYVLLGMVVEPRGVLIFYTYRIESKENHDLVASLNPGPKVREVLLQLVLSTFLDLYSALQSQYREP